MRKRINALVALFILAATAMMSIQTACAQDVGQSSEIIDQPTLKIMQIAGTNETAEEAAERRIWNAYVENLDYYLEIYNNTVKGNASNESYRDAMVANTALLVLNTQGLAEAESITPTEDFRDFHNHTITSMKYFNVFLYNMAKRYETRKSKYSITGGEALNLSIEYYNLGKKEAEFFFDK